MGFDFGKFFPLLRIPPRSGISRSLDPANVRDPRQRDKSGTFPHFFSKKKWGTSSQRIPIRLSSNKQSKSQMINLIEFNVKKLS